MSNGRYGTTWEQMKRIGGSPHISGAFALDKNLWQGRKVAVMVSIDRGNAHRRATSEYWYGTLDLTAGNADQLGVILPDGTTAIVHKNRARTIYDLTRQQPLKGA